MADIDLLRSAGNTADPLIINLKTRADDGTLSDLDCTGFDVLLSIAPEATGVNLSEFSEEDVTASLPDITTGRIEHDVTTAQAAQLVAGAYTVKIKMDDGAGEIRHLPNDLNNGAVKTSLRLVVT